MHIGLVVEGANDECKLLELFQVHYPHLTPHFVITHGTRVVNRTKMNITALQERTETVYFVGDPDEAGDILYQKLSVHFELPRIMFDAQQCLCVRNRKQKIGVEHASLDYLKSVFDGVFV